MIASLLEKTTFAVILAVDNPHTYIGFVAMIFPYLYLTSSVRRSSCAMFSLRWTGDKNLSQCKCAGLFFLFFLTSRVCGDIKNKAENNESHYCTNYSGRHFRVVLKELDNGKNDYQDEEYRYPPLHYFDG